jgi:hypothetical protein
VIATKGKSGIALDAFTLTFDMAQRQELLLAPSQASKHGVLPPVGRVHYRDPLRLIGPRYLAASRSAYGHECSYMPVGN